MYWNVHNHCPVSDLEYLEQTTFSWQQRPYGVDFQPTHPVDCRVKQGSDLEPPRARLLNMPAQQAHLTLPPTVHRKMALPAGLAQAQQAMPAPPPTTIRASDDVTTPRVTSVVPGILVPVDRDITRPFQAPRSRIERAKSVLEGIEFYRQGGIQGMLHLAAIEQKRILREAHRWEAMYGLDDSDATMQRDEEEALVASMSAPAVPGVDYNISTAELSKLSFNRAVDKLIACFEARAADKYERV